MPKFLDDNGLLYFWQKIKSKFLTNVAYDSTNKKLTKTINGTTSDIVTVSTIKTALNLSKSDVGLGNVDNTSDANKPVSTATQTALDGKVDKVTGKALSTNDFTTTLKNKLDGIASGAEVNQNAFSNVKVGSTTVAADAKTDTLELVAGSNITLTPDATNDKVTIAASNTTYSDVVAGGSSGLMSGADKTKLDGIASGAEVNQSAFSNVKVGSTTVAADTKTDTLELAAGSNITLTPDATNDKVTIAATVPAKSTTTPSANGTASAGSETAYAAGDHVHPLQTTVSGNAGTATKLKTARAIDGVSFDGSAGIIHYAVSTSDGLEKIVPCTGFSYGNGARIAITFTGIPQPLTGQSGPYKLNVNGKGLVPVHIYNGSQLSYPASYAGLMLQNYTYEFIYYKPDGDTARFLLVTGINTNTTYSDATTSASGLMSAADKTKLNGIAEGANNYVHPSYTARTGKPTGNATPAFGGSFTVSQITSDATGHVTGATDRTITIPSSVATDSAAGLMSAADHSLLTNMHSEHAELMDNALVYTDSGSSSYTTYGRTVTNSGGDTTDFVISSKVGAASGICPLNASSKIDAQYLPSYVDDIIEAYARAGQTALSSTWLATGSASGTVITPETGKIYVLMADSGDYSANSQFRWSGTAYVKLNDGGVSAITNSEIDTIVAS